MRALPSARRRRIYGTIGVLLLVAIVATGVGAYQQVFTPVVTVTMRADRAGLLTDPGADVRLRGVPVGEVRSVEPAGGDGAKLELALRPGDVDTIPSDVSARIAPNTVFGPKAVLLQAPKGPVSNPIGAGDVVRASRVSTEINDVFDSLQQVLTTVQPGKLNTTLGAMARTLDGRGDELGAYMSQVKHYLDEFNPHLDNLKTDIASSAEVLDTYADVIPDFSEIVKHASTTSRTLTQTQAGLHAVLLDFTRTAHSGKRFLDRTEEPLLTALDTLRPTMSVLAEYSPEYTCVLNGLAVERQRLSRVMGGSLPGIQGRVGFKPAEEPYTYPDDLPKLVTGLGPDCYHVPITPGKTPPKYIFDDGSAPEGDDNSVTVGDPAKIYPRLFGPYAGDFLKNLRESGVLPR